MPLSFLGELLDYAVAEDKRKQEAEDKKELTKLWLVHYIVAKLGKQEPMEYKDFMEKSLNSTEPASGTKKKPSKKKSAEEIMAEFMPIVERDSLKE